MRKKVLIVDDSKFARKRTKDILEALECEVIGEAVDGLDGLEKCKELNPLLLITDIEMPNMDGISMIKELRSYNNDIRIVVISSVVNSHLIQEAVSHGASVLKKPFTQESLFHAIEMLK